MRKYHAENLERELERARQWRIDNPERAKEYMKKYFKAHPEVNKAAVKKYRAKKRLDPEWRSMMAAKAAFRRASDPESYRAYCRDYTKDRYANNPQFNIACRLRARLTKVLRISKAPKFDTTFALVGCSAEFLRGYIEAQFKPGMQWNNIHVDHIRPLASFDLRNEDEQRTAFHYSNLQPLFGVENMQKGSKSDADIRS